MSDTSLYAQIGGEAAVQAAVERFYEKVLADPMLEHFFVRVDVKRLKDHQFAFLSQALGGPKKYSGATMSVAHARLAITQQHFDLVATHLVETLRELAVPESIIAQIAAAVSPLAAEVVNTPSQPAVA